MNREQLRNIVFAKTGVRLDINDPVFALVALNEAVLETYVKEINQSTAALKRATRWSNRWWQLAIAASFISIGAMIGSATALLMPMLHGDQALDQTFGFVVKSQLLNQGGNGELWHALNSDAKRAAYAATHQQ